MDRETLVAELQKSVLEITFTKVDGTKREMVCTLIKSLLPEFKKSTKPARKKNLSVVPVWDLEKEAWRSIKLDSIISVQGEN